MASDLTPESEPITNDVTQKLLDWLDSGGEFVAEQAPLYAQELLDYGAFQCWMLICIAAFSIVFAFATGKWAIKHLAGLSSERAEYARGELKIEIETAITKIVYSVAVAAILGTLVIGYNAVQLYKIKHAPRVYLVEHVRGQM